MKLKHRKERFISNKKRASVLKNYKHLKKTADARMKEWLYPQSLEDLYKTNPCKIAGERAK